MLQNVILQSTQLIKITPDHFENELVVFFLFFFRNIKLLREASISGRLFQFYLCVNRFIEKPLCMCNHLLFVYIVIVTQYKIHTQAHRTHLCMQHERLGRIYRKRRRHDLPHVACGITDYSVDIQRFFFHPYRVC